MININDIKDQLTITPIMFAQIKHKYNLTNINFLDFKHQWQLINDQELQYTMPQILYQHKSFNQTYFGIPIKNVTQSDSARYYYIHINQIRILQTTHPDKPGSYPMLSYQIDQIINNHITQIIRKDMIQKLLIYKTNIVLYNML